MSDDEEESDGDSSSTDANALQRIFESFGIRVRVADDDGSEGSETSETIDYVGEDDVDKDDDEERESKEEGAIALFGGTCAGDKHYPAEVHAVDEILSNNQDSLIEYLERTENQQVSSWGVFSFVVLLYRSHLAHKRTSKVVDAEIQAQKQKGIVEVIDTLPKEDRDRMMQQYAQGLVSREEQQRFDSRIASNIKTMYLIVLFIMFISLVYRVAPIVGNALRVINLFSETTAETTETGKEIADTANEAARYLVYLVKTIGNKFCEKTGSCKPQKMFIGGGGQAKDDKRCFLDFLNEVYEFVNKEIRLLKLPRWIDYEKRTQTQGGRSYGSKHAYHSSTGEENAAAKTFLDALNAWNNLSDNNKLSDDECKKKPDVCHPSDPVSVGEVNESVDRDVDLLRVKQMSNVSVAYGQGGNNPSVVHWEPPTNLYQKDVTDDIDETMRSAALASIRARYVELKNTEKWTGWYYLLTLATALKRKKDQKLLRFYEVKDSDENVAIVPVLRHSPELTIQNVKANNPTHGEDIKNLEQLKRLQNKPKSNLYTKTKQQNLAFYSAELWNETFKRDVLLSGGETSS